MLPGAAAAGSLLAATLALPMLMPFVLMLAAGALAALLYSRRAQAPLTNRASARIGMAGGVAGWLVTAMMLAVEGILGHDQLAGVLNEAVRQQLASNPDRHAQELLLKLSSPGGLAFLVAVGMLLFLVVVLVCGAIGGRLAASLLKKRQEPPRV
jgi:4-amino-4-deoxy-L-arabinose transferase-like glycosyltransferase